MYITKSIHKFKPTGFPGVTVHIRSNTKAVSVETERYLVPYQQEIQRLMVEQQKIHEDERKLSSKSANEAKTGSVNEPVRIEIPDPAPSSPSDPHPSKGLLPSENDVFTPDPLPVPAPPVPARMSLESQLKIIALNNKMERATQTHHVKAYLLSHVAKVTGYAVDLGDESNALTVSTAEELFEYGDERLVDQTYNFIASLRSGLTPDEKLNLEPRSTSGSPGTQVDAQTGPTPVPSASIGATTGNGTADSSPST